MTTARTHDSVRPFEQRIADYGCTEVIRLNEKLSDPAQLDYLDLLPKQSNHAASLTAVAEHQGTALLYLVDACGDAKTDSVTLAKVRSQLANRSEPAWLGVVQAGSLEIFPIGFHQDANTVPVKTITTDATTAPLFFQSLVHGTFEENHRLHGTDYVFRKIFDLLTETTKEFVPEGSSGELDALDILSMAGRSLFFRFLIDRGIVLESERGGRDGICPAATELKDAFSSAEKAAQTSAWLDETFNGDFLPLIDDTIPADDHLRREAEYLRFYRRIERQVGRKIFSHLEAILRGWRVVGGAIQPELDWGDLDFAHIPVGVLSQVYESFSHRADSRTARDTSVHYTPRTIAGLMVEQSFTAVKNPAFAQLLDPACGAGIFLVLAFRRMVRERWQHDEERPKTAVIQEILYGQLRGFDVSESALRLAALALYITAIEVNGSPRPPRDLKFPRNLRNEVLYRFGDNDANKSTAFSLGSLGPEVSTDFNGKFDIVIGNPPWTRLRDEEDDEKSGGKSKTDALNDHFTAIGKRVLDGRGLSELAKRYTNPDKNPDLPFLWRATEWAKQKDKDNAGGIIALAMPARLFGRTTGIGFEAWRSVLHCVSVTGLINGADLRWSSVWKDVKVPFCIFFARNAKPDEQNRFQYATPLNEPDLNSQGRFRIDYETASPISTTRIEKQPWLLKTLSFGTWLDVEVMETLTKPSLKTLAAVWNEWDPNGDRTGKGYDRSPSHPQNKKTFLGDLLDFIPLEGDFGIPWDDLKIYEENHGAKRAAWPRRETLYESPLVIIPQSPGEDGESPRAYFANRDIAFSQSYYGYSCAGHPEAEILAALIYLLAHSKLFSYFCLMTSRRSGFDRQTFNKEEFDALPFPDIVTLPAATKKRICDLAHRLKNDRTKPWDELNSFIFSLYGLDEDAVQVAMDTLFAAASYRKAGKAALERTQHSTRAGFVQSLHTELEPYFDVCGEHVAVRELEFQPDTWREPWFFLAVSRASETVQVNPSLMRKAMEAANNRGVSRIIIHAPNKRGVLLGLLNQRRWWTVTRARLCAQRIINQHIRAFGLPDHR